MSKNKKKKPYRPDPVAVLSLVIAVLELLNNVLATWVKK